MTEIDDLRKSIISKMSVDSQRLDAVLKHYGVAQHDARIDPIFRSAFDAACELIAHGRTAKSAFTAVGMNYNVARRIASRAPELDRMLRRSVSIMEQRRSLDPEADTFVRVSTYHPDRGRNIVDRVLSGMTVNQAAKAEGITSTTLYNWRAAEPQFDAIVARAMKDRPRRPYAPQRKSSPRELWGDAIVDILLREVAAGKSIRNICAAIDMPSASAVYSMMKKHPSFAAEIADARVRNATKEN